MLISQGALLPGCVGWVEPTKPNMPYLPESRFGFLKLNPTLHGLEVPGLEVPGLKGSNIRLWTRTLPLITPSR